MQLISNVVAASRNTNFIIMTSLTALWAIVNYPVMETLWRHGFDDGTYSHAFLIPFLIVYLFAVLGPDPRIQTRKTGLLMPALLFLLVAVAYFFAIAAQINLLVWGLSIALLGSAFLVVYRFSWLVLFPVFYLIFMYPLWGSLQGVLQSFSVFAVSQIMHASPVPVYVEGTSVAIPSGVFVIAGGCSGLRYFLVSLAISSLFVFLNLRSRKRIIAFVSVAILGAIITNWIRIVALILIGHFSEMESDLMRDHNNFGWYIYMPFLVFLFYYGGKLADRDEKERVEEQSAKLSSSKVNKPSTKLALIGAVSLLLSSSALSIAVFVHEANVDETCQSQMPAWDVLPHLPYPASVCYSQYFADGNEIKVAKAVFNGSDLDGKPTQYQIRYVPEGASNQVKSVVNDWNLVTFGFENKRYLVAYQFEINNQTTASSSRMKVLRIKNSLKHIRQSTLNWRAIECAESCDGIVDNWQTLIAATPQGAITTAIARAPLQSSE